MALNNSQESVFAEYNDVRVEIMVWYQVDNRVVKSRLKEWIEVICEAMDTLIGKVQFVGK